jgi:hypothetical protein
VGRMKRDCGNNQTTGKAINFHFFRNLSSFLPAFLLLTVAVVQVVLVKTYALSPWKGGGFGMFATTDGGPFRQIRVFVEAPQRSEELLVAPYLEDSAARAQLFPSNARLANLARAIAEREERHGWPVTTVRLEVLRTEFSPGSLDVTNHRLRDFIFYVDKAPDKPGE